ncbi:uncharacterized protein LOC110436141 [Sorghum bicolor]|uniref:Uncharacterized protein n=1 Tax=Sorghum bicolor TaxID=4558 RepID=A0A1B6PL91_SORBI|nr:uncharacterized protein LOC110436141 [Sorghum bicolor]KXG26435.1 hypothetical protein SORBI_3006G101300 [Sorghum bicolor]|eukprot:XP_021318074.1 uncharacterized protein LOC110436141 [Sorghum bicolor]
MALDAKALQAAKEAAVPVALGAGTARRPPPSSWNGGAASPATTTSTATSVGVPVPVVMLCSDDRRMKEELVAWAKAVASLVVRESLHC